MVNDHKNTKKHSQNQIQNNKNAHKITQIIEPNNIGTSGNKSKTNSHKLENYNYIY